ncbi:hypothetical protein BJ170DRAFT_373101 [Xylariales sp. AK1849]|nr:hypothetical protein BJ170DRAFT_373101 [Xylariales sp. AK1849]
MAQEGQRPFHIIIAGSGLVGLSAAHVFSSLQSSLPPSVPMTFTILEAHEFATGTQIGSALSLWPPTFRIFDQLRLLPTLRPVLERYERTITFNADTGVVFHVNEALGRLMPRNHGWEIRVTHRPEFLGALWEGLGEEARGRVRGGMRIVDVRTDEEGVEVECENGTVVKGDVLIGADGVRSRVRECMQRLSLETRTSSQVGVEKAREKGAGNAGGAYTTTYRMLFGNLPFVLPGLPHSTNCEGARFGVSTQVLSGVTRSWWGVYEKLDEPTSERTRYTEADKAGVVERWGDLYMAPGWKLRDVVEQSNGLERSGLINLEEGAVEEWAWNRIVLVGDAVRKLEPHAGLGYNSGLADVVALANKLRTLLLDTATNKGKPTTAALERLFGEYQEERMEVAPMLDKISRRRAREVAWLEWKDSVMARWVQPYFPMMWLGITYIFGPIIAKSPVLDWVAEVELPAHEVEYQTHGFVQEADREKAEKMVARSRKGATRLSLGAAAVLLVGLTGIGLRYYRLF